MRDCSSFQALPPAFHAIKHADTAVKSAKRQAFADH